MERKVFIFSIQPTCKTSSTCSQSAMKTFNKKMLDVSSTCAFGFKAIFVLSYQRKKVLAPLKSILSLAS